MLSPQNNMFYGEKFKKKVVKIATHDCFIKVIFMRSLQNCILKIAFTVSFDNPFSSQIYWRHVINFLPIKQSLN